MSRPTLEVADSSVKRTKVSGNGSNRILLGRIAR
jgi:hypothetical protein